MKILDSLRPKLDSSELPLLYVRDAVVFPHSITPVLAATKLCIAAAEIAVLTDKKVFVSLLKALPKEGANDLDVHEIGTICHIIQVIKLGDGSQRLLLDGRGRAHLKKTVFKKDYIAAVVEPLTDDNNLAENEKACMALMKIIKQDFSVYADLVKKLSSEAFNVVIRSDEPHRLCNAVANVLALKVDTKQRLLSIINAEERLQATAQVLAQENEMLSIQKKISQKIRSRLDKNQKDHFLQEQLREINKELGKDSDENEYNDLLQKIEAKSPPAEVLDKAKKEIARLNKLQAFSPEAGVIRAYCEWLSDLPWSTKKNDSKDLLKAKQILDEDHYGMKKAKERILEFIAVRQLNASVKGPILCFVGPPGTGKTSLGRSIARALDRDFIRISLGGVRDEAEIRGHRKTYVGALPGKILQSMKKVSSINPVFLLDEIDKMSSDFRGDPASALLEVLDPEQNYSFADHYLELPFDLSSVMFITTANSMHGIPYPLLDRMEVIEIPGYSEYEKLEIAKKFIVPKQIIENGLTNASLRIRDDALLEIIRYYTMESGVRSLEREIAHVIRKIAEDAVKLGYANSEKPITDFKKTITAASLKSKLGKRKHDTDLVFAESPIGVAYGLAWTEMGGTVLPVEASGFEGEGELILTGNLGDVMKESAKAALTFLRAHSSDYGLSLENFSGKTMHIHVPEGAIPKDGPSAGITLVTAMASALTGKAVVKGWAMTGEITLTGRILAIGGVKEKILAAHRNKLYNVLLPKANKNDIDDIPNEIAKEMKFKFCDTIKDAFEILLSLSNPSVIPDEQKK